MVSRLLLWLFRTPLYRARGDKLYLLGDDFGADPAALRAELMARHLRSLPAGLRAAHAEGHHPAQSHARMAEARSHASELLRELAHLPYVNDVMPSFQGGDRIGLTVVLRTPHLPPGLRGEVPWLYRGFETRCLPRGQV